MKRIILRFDLANWEIIPKKQGLGWGFYLRFKFLFLRLELDWEKYPEMEAKASPTTL